MTDDKSSGAVVNELLSALADAQSRSGAPIDEGQIRALIQSVAKKSVAHAVPPSLQHMFEQRAREAAATPALIESRHQCQPDKQCLRLTYIELNARANQLARYIIRRGHGEHGVVACCSESPTDRLLTLLAAQKAGACYVAIPMSVSLELIYEWLASVCPLVVVCSKTDGRISCDSALISLEREAPEISLEAEDNVSNSADPASPAYIGLNLDKSVVVHYRALNEHVKQLQATFPLSANDRFIASSGPLLTSEVWEFLWPLSQGAALIVPSPTASGTELLDLVSEHGVTVAHLNTQKLDELTAATECRTNATDSLRLMLCGGGYLSLNTVESFHERCSSDLHYVYSPFGAGNLVAAGRCLPESICEQTFIGATTEGRLLCVMDPNLCPTPIGVVGELCVIGESLPTGYLNDFAKTSSDFVTSPFDKAKRLFRSGDKGRRRHDGTFELVNQHRGQLWIEGAPVDTKQVESRLVKIDAIEKCVVLARMSHQKRIELVAYVQSSRAILSDEFRVAAERLLPRHLIPKLCGPMVDLPVTARGEVDIRALMRLPVVDEFLLNAWRNELSKIVDPSCFIVMPSTNPNVEGRGDLVVFADQAEGAAHFEGLRVVDRYGTSTRCLLVYVSGFPQTKNGEIDYAKLADIANKGTSGSSVVAPRNRLEQQLCEIWTSVLGIESIGVYDSFFELGGDSIDALRVIAQASDRGIFLSAEQIFKAPTIAALASIASCSRPKLRIDEQREGDEVPITPSQAYFFEHNLALPSHFNHAYLFEAQRRIDVQTLELALQAVIKHHDAFRLRFERGATGWRQFTASTEENTLCTALDLTTVPEELVLRVFENYANQVQRSLDLACGPLIRVLVADRNKKCQLILIVVHHLVVDGYSWRILLEDLDLAYSQTEKGKAVSLPKNTTSFRVWAQEMSAVARASARVGLDYWLDQDWSGEIGFPHDMSGVNIEGSSANVSVDLELGQSQSLLRNGARKFRAQVHELFVMGMLHALRRHSGRRRFLIDLAHHGRRGLVDTIDLSRTIGWFSVFCPVVLDLGDSEDPIKELKAVSAQLAKVPDQGFSFFIERYVGNDLGTTAQLRKLPKPTILLNYGRHFDGLFDDRTLLRMIGPAVGDIHDLGGTRMYELVFNQLAINGRLGLGLTYSSNLHRRDTVERIASSYLDALRALAADASSE